MEMKNESVPSKQQEDMVEHEDEEEGLKWVTHYSSDHQILLVGDGDFSFSLCLANSFRSAANVVATSLDSYDDVTRKYQHAKSNLDQLQKLGAYLLHGVDATKMKLHPDLKMLRFDRIIFNFPHAGFYGEEDNVLMIKMHRDLVFGFFKNASCMLRADGEIHVNHKTTAPFDHWNIDKLAMQSSLTMIECTEFKMEDYPGYNNKRGHRVRCDEPFPLGKCSTFKFIYNPKARRNWKNGNHTMFARQQTRLPFQEIQDAVEQFPAPIDLHYYPQTSHIPRMNEPMTSTLNMTYGHTPIPRDYFNNVEAVHRRTHPSVGYHPYAHGINLGSPRSLQPRDSLQSLQPWPTSSNARYPLTGHVGIIDNVPLSHGGSSNNLQEGPCRRPQMSSYFDSARTDFERYIAEETRRTLNAQRSSYFDVGTRDTVPLTHGARNEDNQVFGGSSNYLQEAPYRTVKRPYFDVGRSMDTIPLSHGARNEDYQVFGGSSNYLQEAPYRTVNGSYYDVGRTMDTVPLSHGARNEGYQFFGGCPNYLPEAVSCRTGQRPSYFRNVRTDCERYIAEETGRSVNAGIFYNEPHRMSVLMPERKMFVGS